MTAAAAASRHAVDVAIVGAGFAGLCAAIRLKQSGRDDFVVLEREADVGGTWLLNRYPGCACDVPSHLYSYSFAPNPRWRREFASQPDIHAYLRDCARRFGILPHLRLRTEVTAAHWDEALRCWRIRLGDGSSLRARVLISAVGGLSRPLVPDIPGLDDFRGAHFHSQQWRDDVPLRGARVAVVGTGASAIQFVPQIARQARRLTVYQRSAPWILPRPDRPIGPLSQAVFRALPAAMRARRAALYLQLEARALAMVGFPRLLRLAERAALAHLHRQVPDPALRRLLTPDYPIGCKRILLSNDYYPALLRDHVELVTGGVRAITPRGVIDGDGVERPADVIVFGTGFDVRNPLGPLDIRGRDGRSIHQVWADTPSAHLGMTVAGFPNLFILLGPNSGLGHNSIVYMIESQVNYLLDALDRMARHGIHAVDLRPEVQRRFAAEIDAMTRRSVWGQPGCRGWYFDEHGRNFTLWPGYTFRYRLATRRFAMHAYHPLPAPRRAEPVLAGAAA